MRATLSFFSAALIALGSNAAIADEMMSVDELASRLGAQLQSGQTSRSFVPATPIQAAPLQQTYLPVEQAPAQGRTRGFNQDLILGEPEPTAPVEAVDALPEPIRAEPAAQGSVVTVSLPEAPERSLEPALPSFEELPVPTYILESGPNRPTQPIQQARIPASEPPPEPLSTATYIPWTEPEAATPVEVAKTYTPVSEEVRVDLRIFFALNSASLKPESIAQLSVLCAAIRQVGVSSTNQFKIIGHTDKSGDDSYNLYLSRARANEVKRHLVEECSLPDDALIAVGEGENQSSPDTPQNAPKERRVEIQAFG